MTKGTNPLASYKGSFGPLVLCCQKCRATSPRLLRCVGCQAVRYCSVEHQVADQSAHKTVCDGIKQTRDKFSDEDRRLRIAEPDSLAICKALKTAFELRHAFDDDSDIWDARAYLKARYALIAGQLPQMGTLDSVSEALEHMRDIMGMTHRDDLGLRYLMPLLMLRLDLDEACYDFMKYWVCNRSIRNNYKPHGPELRDQDVFEDPALTFGHGVEVYWEIEPILPVLLLKLKLLVDVLNVKVARKVLRRSPLPTEIENQIEQAVVRSMLSTALHRGNQKSLLEREAILVSQIHVLGTSVGQKNEDFMYTLFKPDKALSTTVFDPSRVQYADRDNWQQCMYATWRETEGVLKLLIDARTCAARASKSKIEGIMEQRRLRGAGGLREDAEEMLRDVSLDDMWDYLEYAAKDASYLGPKSDRPSERLRREKKGEEGNGEKKKA